MARAELPTADKRKVEAHLSYAYIRIGEREGVLPVAIVEAPEPHARRNGHGGARDKSRPDDG